MEGVERWDAAPPPGERKAPNTPYARRLGRVVAGSPAPSPTACVVEGRVEADGPKIRVRRRRAAVIMERGHRSGLAVWSRDVATMSRNVVCSDPCSPREDGEQ